MAKPKLITVPTFTFNQGDTYVDEISERPISVDFYEGSICLRQDGDFDQQEVIIIAPKFLKALFKEIIRMEEEVNLLRKNKIVK